MMLKLLLIAVGTAVSLVIATIAWIMIMGIGMPKGSAVDIALLLRSPFYWLTIIAVLVLFGWFARRWAFSG
jgi:hypothetical protein